MIASTTTSSTFTTKTPKEETKESLETAAVTSVMNTLENSSQEVSLKKEETNIEKIESCVEDLFKKLHAQFNDSQSILKTLANNLKILHKEVQKEKRDLIKNAKKTKEIKAKKTKENKENKEKKTGKSGFAKPSRISEKLADFLEVPKDKLIARTDVTKMIAEYVKENNLQNPDYKKEILPDEKLRNLLEPYFTKEDKLEYCSIQKYLKYHYLKE